MSLRELLLSLYAWADAHAPVIALAVLAVPVVGTLAAWIGKGGSTDRDGRWIASQVILLAALGVVVMMLGVAAAQLGFGRSILDANLLLVASPPLALVVAVIGIRWLFPLNQLGSVRTLGDVALFVLACVVLLWLLGKFRGWGIVFLGGLGSLAIVAALAAWLLWQLFGRAFRR